MPLPSVPEFLAATRVAYRRLRCTGVTEFFEWARLLRQTEPYRTDTAGRVLERFCDDCDFHFELRQRTAGRCTKPQGGWVAADLAARAAEKGQG